MESMVEKILSAVKDDFCPVCGISPDVRDWGSLGISIDCNHCGIGTDVGEPVAQIKEWKYQCEIVKVRDNE